ncbi:MAG: hypothetical protein Kow0074_16430 [Candidatus Zixiibacteriota bacterium]
MTPKNLTASVRARLLNVAYKRAEDYELVLRRYALERFLYRLSQSPYVKQFVLKGAFLQNLWTSNAYRPTRDLDLLGYGRDDHAWIRSAIEGNCGTPDGESGLEFDMDTLRVDDIRDDQAYHGVRARLLCHLGGTRIPVQIDIGFGDVVVPEARQVAIPSLLGMPEPQVYTYTRESVIAEKLHAMVVLGMANSRMKD